MRTDTGIRNAHRLAALAALVAAVALAGCGSDGDTESRTTPADVGESGSGQLMKDTTPAAIVDHPQGFVSSDVLRPVVNGWRTSSTETFTEVDAGAVAYDRSTGALAIFRHDFVEIAQSSNLIKVKDSGPLTITKAPEGKGVEEFAQEDGEIEFEGKTGVTGTLDLSDDSVSLSGR